MGKAKDVPKQTRAAISSRAKDCMRAWRIANNISTRSMAMMLGVPRRTYEKWEAPHEKHRANNVPPERIAQFLEMSGIDANIIMLGHPQRAAALPPVPTEVAKQKKPRAKR